MKNLIIPQPQEYIKKSGIVALKDFALSAVWTDFVPKSREVLDQSGFQQIQLETVEGMELEEYRISIAVDKIIVKASAPNGAYYALCTIRQLGQLGNGELDCCEIHDYPTMAIRGFSDDISRGQISTFENFKDIIRRLSLVKCNLYMPYIEDTFAFHCLPESGKYSDPVSQEEWKALVAYAKDYYVKIIPIINILGHWDKNGKLTYFDSLMLKEGDSAEGIPLQTLDTRKQEVRDLVATMLDEAIAVFGDAKAIHVGGDEVVDLNLFNKEEGARFYNGHFQFAWEHLKKQNMKMLMYSDMYTPVWGDYQIGINKIDEMPQDIGFVYWDYACRKDYQNIKDLIAKQREFYISPATMSWNRFLPHHYNAWLNTKSVAATAEKKSSGMIMSAWCDGGMTLREENWFGLYCAALYSWNDHADFAFDQVVSTFFMLFYGIDVDLQEYHQLFDYDKASMKPYDPQSAEKKVEFWYEELANVGANLFREFWKDATLPVDPEVKQRLEGVHALERFEKGFAYFKGLTPMQNKQAYEVFLFDILRSTVAAKKLDLLTDQPYRTREQAMADIPQILSLAEEVERLMDENERQWMATNRQSEWDYAKGKYLDLQASLLSLARYCKNGKRMTVQKKL